MSETKDDVLISNKEKIQNLSFSTKMYISSRRDFLNGISLGIIGSITAAYIVELDKTIFMFSPYQVLGILVRIFLLTLLLIIIINRYRKRTKIFENSLQGMIERLNDINRELEKSRADGT